MVGLDGLERWVILLHYFGTTLLKGCRPLVYTKIRRRGRVLFKLPTPKSENIFTSVCQHGKQSNPCYPEPAGNCRTRVPSNIICASNVTIRLSSAYNQLHDCEKWRLDWDSTFLTVHPILNCCTDYAVSADTSIAQYFPQLWIALVCIWITENVCFNVHKYMPRAFERVIYSISRVAILVGNGYMLIDVRSDSWNLICG